MVYHRRDPRRMFDHFLSAYALGELVDELRRDMLYPEELAAVLNELGRHGHWGVERPSENNRRVGQGGRLSAFGPEMLSAVLVPDEPRWREMVDIVLEGRGHDGQEEGVCPTA